MGLRNISVISITVEKTVVAIAVLNINPNPKFLYPKKRIGIFKIKIPRPIGSPTVADNIVAIPVTPPGEIEFEDINNLSAVP